MFLPISIVLICLVAVNSSTEYKKIEGSESRVVRSRYSVPREIRDRVPVDFAATNLRESRLKNRFDKNVSRSHSYVAGDSKPSTGRPKLGDTTKIPTKPPKYTKRKGQKRKRPVNDKSRIKKPLRFRTNNIPNESFTKTQRPAVFFDEVPFDGDSGQSESRATTNFNAAKAASGNSFADIEKAINALPHQTVKIIRDDSDCNDDPTKMIPEARGPPCSFSTRWPGTGGHPAFWMNNVVPQNWQLFHNE